MRKTKRNAHASTIRASKEDLKLLEWIGKQIGVNAKSEVARYCYKHVQRELKASENKKHKRSKKW